MNVSEEDSVSVLLYRDYFTKSVTRIPCITSSSSEKEFHIPISDTSLVLLSVNRAEESAYISPADTLVYDYDKGEMLNLKTTRALHSSLSSLSKEAQKLLESFKHKVSFKEFEEWKGFFAATTQRQGFLRDYALSLKVYLQLKNKKRFRKVRSLNDNRKELESIGFHYQIIPNIYAMREYVMALSWNLFHTRQTSMWMQDSAAMKFIFGQDPFSEESMNGLYKVLAVNQFFTYNLLQEKSLNNYFRGKCDSVLQTFKSKKDYRPFVLAYNYYQNYWGLKRKQGQRLALFDSNGNMKNLGFSESGFYLVDFWATWCGPCISGMKELNIFAKNHPQISVLCISVERNFEAFKAWKYFDEYPYLQFLSVKSPVLTKESYGVIALPHRILIDGDYLIYDNNVGDLQDIIPYIGD